MAAGEVVETPMFGRVAATQTTQARGRFQCGVAVSVEPRMNIDWSAPRRYLVALGIFGAALGLRVLFLPASFGWSFLTFHPALTLAAVVCGASAGVMLTLAFGPGYYWLLSPHSSLGDEPDGVIAAAIFTITGLGIVWIVRRMHDFGGRWQRAAAVASESERRYHAVIEDMTDMIHRYTGDGVLILVNDAFCRMIGQTRTELLGTRWTSYPLVEDVPLIEAQNGLLSPDRPIVTIECRFCAQNRDVRDRSPAGRRLRICTSWRMPCVAWTTRSAR